MAIDDATLAVLDEAVPLLPLQPGEAVSQKRMFGGVAYLLNGKMLAGVAGSRLMIRLEPEEFDEASEAGLVSPMDFTGRPMKGFAFVEPPGFDTREKLVAWLQTSARYVRKHMLP